MTKLIFLDFDGVLNSNLFYQQTRVRGEDGKLQLPIPEVDLDPRNVKYLNKLIKDTEAKVVVSSTWRLGRTVEELQKILESVGFVGEVIDKTKDLRYGDGGKWSVRGNEIHCWMDENHTKYDFDQYHFKNYVIFDDDSDMLYWQRNNYIQIDSYCGLTPNNVFRAEKILNS